MNEREPLVTLKGVTKTFGSTLAVDEVTLSLFAGEVLGLVGGNGSGKSTLMNVLAGHHRPDGGSIVVNGETVEFSHAQVAIRQGISMLSQFPEIFAGLNVVENIFAGQEIKRRPTFAGALDWAAMSGKARELLSQVGAADLPLEQAAGSLSGGQQKAVAIARVLAREATVVIFDEPNASLGLRQQAITSQLIADNRRAGKAVVVVTHELHDVQANCDRIAVMTRGQLTADKSVSTLTSAQLSDYMSG